MSNDAVKTGKGMESSPLNSEIATMDRRVVLDVAHQRLIQERDARKNAINAELRQNINVRLGLPEWFTRKQRRAAMRGKK